MSVLKIHMTYQCTAECHHCRFRCSQEPSPAIPFDTGMAVVEALRACNNLEMVVLMGGEPGVVPALTHRLTAACRELGLDVRVETNASWAASVASAAAFLAPLYRAGASVMFSLDGFHAPYIPLDSVERAVRVSDCIGGDYCFEMAYVSPGRDAPEDVETDALLAELERRLGRSPVCERIYKGNVLFNGRAADMLADSASAGRGLPDGPCRAAPWWLNGEHDSAELLILDPEGYLSKGCGIVLGNAHKAPVREILASFDPARHRVFSILLDSGPIGLAEQAAKHGYRLKTDYADPCHLCQEARDVLQGHWHEWLRPGQHYRKPVTDG